MTVGIRSAKGFISCINDLSFCLPRESRLVTGNTSARAFALDKTLVLKRKDITLVTEYIVRESFLQLEVPERCTLKDPKGKHSSVCCNAMSMEITGASERSEVLHTQMIAHGLTIRLSTRGLTAFNLWFACVSARHGLPVNHDSSDLTAVY